MTRCACRAHFQRSSHTMPRERHSQPTSTYPITLTLLPQTKLFGSHRPCGYLIWSKMWSHQLCLKKNGSKSWAKPTKPRLLRPSWSRKMAASSGPSPLQCWLGSMWFLVVPPRERKVGWVEIFSHSPHDLAKAVSSELHALTPYIYKHSFKSWCRWLEVCVRNGGECFEEMWML